MNFSLYKPILFIIFFLINRLVCAGRFAGDQFFFVLDNSHFLKIFLVFSLFVIKMFENKKSTFLIDFITLEKTKLFINKSSECNINIISPFAFLIPKLRQLYRLLLLRKKIFFFL